jgi:hypothetical protein
VFALLVGVNVYVFFFSSGSLKKVSQAAQSASTHAAGVMTDPPAATAPAPAAPTVAVSPSQPAPLAAPEHATSTATTAAPAPAPHAAPSPKKASSGTVRERDAIGTILKREGLDSVEVDRVIRALRPIMDFKREIHPGEKYTVRYDDEGHLEAFELTGTTARYVVVRDASGKLDGTKVTR